MKRHIHLVFHIASVAVVSIIWSNHGQGIARELAELNRQTIRNHDRDALTTILGADALLTKLESSGEYIPVIMSVEYAGEREKIKQALKRFKDF